MRDLYHYFLHVAYGRGSVLLRQGDEIPGEGAVLGFFSSLTRYFTAQHLGPIQKRLNRSRCRLGCWVGLARETVLRGVTTPEEEGQFWGEMCPTSLTPLWITNWTGSYSGVHRIRADAWLQALDECISVIGHEGGDVGLHTAGEVWYLRLL